MLLTRRLERARAAPLGFVANEYALAIWGLNDMGAMIDDGRHFLERTRGRIRHIALPQVSPLAVPVMLEIGRESVPGEASEALLRETVEELLAEALRGHAAPQT